MRLRFMAGFSLILLLLRAPSRAVEDPRNWVTNGDFSGPVTGRDGTEGPAGWTCSPALQVRRVSAASGAPFLQIRAATPPAGGAYVSQTLPYEAPGGEAADFALTCEVKFDDCRPGPQGYMKARILVLYTTADRVLHDRYYRHFQGSSDWQPVTLPCTFPADTKELQVLLGFHTSSGTLCVRKVRLGRVNRADLPEDLPGVVRTPLAPGVVETDYGVTRTLEVDGQLWYELPDRDPAAEWYNRPNQEGDYDPLLASEIPFTAAERARGYVVFQRRDTMVASASNHPQREEILAPDGSVPLDLCAGETRSTVLIVYPLRELPSFRIVFPTLTNAAGDRIAPGNLRADVIETVYYRANPFQHYAKMPRAIRRVETRDLPAGNGSQFWIYCAIPAGTPAGRYKGRAQLVSAGQVIGEVALHIRVYPFELLPTPVHWSMYYYYLPDADLDRDLAYMRTLGMNSVIYSPPATSMFERLKLTEAGEPEFDFTPDDQFMAAYRKAGYTRPVIYYPRLLLLRLVHLYAPEETFPQTDFHTTLVPLITRVSDYPPAACAAYQKVLQQIVAHAQAASWPEWVLYLTDEPFLQHWREYETAVSYRLARAVCPGIKTFCTLYDPVLVDKYGRSIDYVSSRGLQCAAPRPENRAMRAACARTGAHLWASCWPLLWWHNYWYARAYAGFVCERSGFEGMNVWLFAKHARGETYPFQTLRPGGSAGGIPVCWQNVAGQQENHTVLEGLREGILDARYLATLKEALRQAEEAGQAVADYRQELAAMIASAPPLLADSDGSCCDRPGLHGVGAWSVEENERLRQRLAEMIIALQRRRSGRRGAGNPR